MALLDSTYTSVAPILIAVFDTIGEQWWLLLALLMVVILWYYLFCVPFSTTNDFSDFGFEQVKERGRGSKKMIVNQMNRRRKLADLPPVFPNGWFVILESEKIKPGETQELYMMGENLVVWRGVSGKIYVANAYCPHLGAHLGVGGQVSQECIKCPLHGWQFDGTDGRVANIPYSSSSLDKFDSAKLKMKKAVENCGFIYMYFDAEGTEPTWMPDIIPEIETGRWKYRGRSDFLVSTILQDVQENGADRSHFAILHTPTILAGPTPWIHWWHSIFTTNNYTSEWKVLTDNNSTHISATDVMARIRLFNLLTIIKMSVRIIQVGPGLARVEFRTLLGDGVIMMSTTPVEPILQKVTNRFYTSSMFIQPLARILHHLFDVMLCRDVVIWNRKTFLNNPQLAKEDATIRTYRKWFSQFYSPNSPLYSPVSGTMEF